jgi:hypothetical protein
MANLSTPPSMSTLGEVVKAVQAETDYEVKPDKIVRFVNQELGSLSTKREWTFFYQTTTATLGIADANGESSLPLPLHMKKLFQISTTAPAISGDEAGKQVITFEQDIHYRLTYDSSTSRWTATFFNIGNTATQTMIIEYYMQPVRLIAETDDTKIPERFANVLILATNRRVKRYLMDIQESVLDDRQFKEELQSMIDDDAREQDLPKQMRPNKGQAREEFGDDFNDQKNGEVIYQKYI